MKKPLKNVIRNFLIILLTGLALPVFSQDGIPARQHLPVQKGKSEIVLSGSYRTRGEIQQEYNIIHQPEFFLNLNKEGAHTFTVYNTVKNLPFLIDVFYVYKYDKISARGMVTQLSYLFKTFLNSQLLFTHIYGSGDGNPNDGKHQTFDGIFSSASTG